MTRITSKRLCYILRDKEKSAKEHFFHLIESLLSVQTHWIYAKRKKTTHKFGTCIENDVFEGGRIKNNTISNQRVDLEGGGGFIVSGFESQSNSLGVRIPPESIGFCLRKKLVYSMVRQLFFKNFFEYCSE
jgi:hypothetical protein